MKKTFKLLNYVAVLFIAITSCHKDHGNYVAPSPPMVITVIDTLPGKEFSFSDLTWDYSLDDWELCLYIGNRADLFRFDRLMEVSVKSVTDSNWVIAQRSFNPSSFSGYTYGIDREKLYVYPYPYINRAYGNNNQLAGSKASVKVKFL